MVFSSIEIIFGIRVKIDVGKVKQWRDKKLGRVSDDHSSARQQILEDFGSPQEFWEEVMLKQVVYPVVGQLARSALGPLFHRRPLKLIMTFLRHELFWDYEDISVSRWGCCSDKGDIVIGFQYNLLLASYHSWGKHDPGAVDCNTDQDFGGDLVSFAARQRAKFDPLIAHLDQQVEPTYFFIPNDCSSCT